MNHSLVGDASGSRLITTLRNPPTGQQFQRGGSRVALPSEPTLALELTPREGCPTLTHITCPSQPAATGRGAFVSLDEFAYHKVLSFVRSSASGPKLADDTIRFCQNLRFGKSLRCPNVIVLYFMVLSEGGTCLVGPHNPSLF